MASASFSTRLPLAAGWGDAPAAEDGDKDVPFSPLNRMKTFLVLAMLIDSIIVIGGVVWLQKYNVTSTSTPLSYAIIAFGGLGLKELLAMIHAHQEARQTRHDLRGAIGHATDIIQDTKVELLEKTNGGLTKAVKEVGEQVRVAAHDQAINEVLESPKFEAVMDRVIVKTCERLEAEKQKAEAEKRGQA